MTDGGPELELAKKITHALDDAGVFKSASDEDTEKAKGAFQKAFATGQMDSYAWKRLYERAADKADAEAEDQL